MKPDDRMPDFWNRVESRPATRNGEPYRKSPEETKADDDLAALLEEYNNKRQLQRRIERLGNLFMGAFVILFILVVFWLQVNN